MPAIHALKVGHMLAENYRGGKNGTTYVPCKCGGDMYHTAEMCRECRNAVNEQARKAYKRPADEMSRHHLWGLAIEAGWKHEELCALGRRNALPTMAEIAERDAWVVIQSWWRGAE